MGLEQKRQLIGIDIGTSACKVAAFEEDGRLLKIATKSYPVYYPYPGWAEQDAEEWWNAVREALRDVLATPAVDVNRICGIGVDGQGWSAIPIDRDGKVLHRTPIWMDTRCREICEEIKEKTDEEQIFRVSGNDFLPSYTTPKIIWLKRNFPDMFGRIYKVLQSNSYIVYRLTGVLSQDVSQGYGLHFFDMKKLAYDEALARELGLSTKLVPEIYGCDQIVGKVTESAAAACGLKAGIPVVAGGLDAACGALGAGVYKPGQTQEQGGQAGGMSICTEYPHAHKQLILGAHVVPGTWLLQGGTVGGGGTLRWFQRELGGKLSFDELTAEAAKIPAGAEGVIFLPYMSGERSPVWNPDAKGVFYGLSFGKTRGHMVRALLEGVAFSLEHNLRTAAETGIPVAVLNAMGGAANSVLWTQIKADVTGKKIVVPASDTATTLGAAILAGVGCGLYRDYEEAVGSTIQIARVQEPNMENHELYKQSMELYLELYQNLKETFSKFSL